MLLQEPYNPSRKSDLSLESPKVSFFWPLHLRILSLSVHLQSNISLNRLSCICKVISLAVYTLPLRFSRYHWNDLAFNGSRPWLSYPVESPELIYELSATICLPPCTAKCAGPSCPEVDPFNLVPGGSFNGAPARHITKVEKEKSRCRVGENLLQGPWVKLYLQAYSSPLLAHRCAARSVKKKKILWPGFCWGDGKLARL